MNHYNSIYRLNSLIGILLLIGLVGLLKIHAADSLDIALGGEQTEYQEASPETKALWENILSSLERNEYDKAPALLHQFEAINDVVEPYQKTFCAITLQLLTPPGNTSKQTGAANPQQADIDAAKSQIESLDQDISSEESKRPPLLKKVNQAKTGGEVVGVLGGALGISGMGGISTAMQQDAEHQLADIDRKIREDKQGIANQEALISKLKDAGLQELTHQANTELQQASAFHQQVLNFLIQQKEDKHYRPVIALANVWETKRGQDLEIDKIAQDTVDLQKIEAKAIQIAQAASKPATDLITEGKIWSAEAEISRAEDLIKNQVTDPLQLEFIQKEMFSTQMDVKHQIQVGLKKRAVILEIAQRDASEGAKQYDAFLKGYPDYPDQDQDRLTINDLKTQQVEAKYAQRIADIEEVIPNDPDEAKRMIQKLFNSGISEDEISILKSKVVKLKRQILDQEIELVTKDLDEAQSYLTRTSATYAAEFKQGGKPNLSFIESVSTGSENLVRARSLQAGGIKRLEMLLNEDTDNVTKSRLVGLLETQKSALEELDSTIALQGRDKMIATVMIGILVCVGMGGILFIVLLFRKKKASA